MFSATFLCVLAITGLAHGHGMMKQITISGKSYPGSAGPGANPSQSPARPVSGPDPVKDLTSMDVACGLGAQGKTAGVTAEINAGDNIDIHWQGGTGINWFHNVGPVMTYMTSCNGDCNSFQPSKDTKWFKIDEQGETGDIGTPWAQAKLNSGAPTSVSVPKELASGNYLLRQEIITLQIAQSQGGAEFYPGCVQLKVNGGGSTKASSISPSANLPGAYKPTDPGILVDIYTPTQTKYKFPGPAVANIAGGKSDSGSGDAPASPSSSDSTPAAPTGSSEPASPSDTTSTSESAPSSTGKSSKKGGNCKKKRSPSVARIVKKSAQSTHKKRRMAAH